VDTNAAIVGAALGALHGFQGIPERLRAPVLSRGPASPGRPRPEYLQGRAAEPLVRRLWALACGGGAGASAAAGGAR
jgi:hypothetical protein